MTVFAILMPSPQPALAAKIASVYQNDYLEITDTQWLVSTVGTTMEVCQKLGIYDPANPKAAATGSAVVFATSSYFGRASVSIWEWIKVKLEGGVTTSG